MRLRNSRRMRRAGCPFRNPHHWTSTVLILLVAAGATQCSFESPSAPRWDADFTVPLINQSYTLAELVDEEDALFVGTDSLIHFEFEQDLDRYYVGDVLKVEGFSETFDFELGVFSIKEPPPQQMGVSLEDIYPEASTLDGLRLPVPPFQFSLQPQPLTPFEEFGYVLVEQARVSFRVDNLLPIPLGPSLWLEIRDSATDTVIATVSHSQTVDPGDFFVEELLLEQSRIPNALSVRVAGGSPGSTDPVLIDSQASFQITTDIHELRVSEASAKVPPQHLEGVEEVGLSDSLLVSEAAIETGAIRVLLQGTFPLEGLLSYAFPDFIGPGGQPLQGQVRLSRNLASEINVDVSNFRFLPQPAPMGQQKVRFAWTFDSDDSGDQMVLVKSTDMINAQLDVSQIRFAEISGSMYGQTIQIDQQSFEFDIPAGLDSVVLESGRLELTINNAVNFPARTDLVVEGENESGTRVEVEIREVIQPALDSGVPTPTTIVFDTNDQQVAAFINALPKLVRVFGKVVIGDQDWLGRITANDFVDGKVRLTAPLSLTLPPQTVEETLDEIEIEQETRDELQKRVDAGQIVAEIGNHLPVGATAELFFGSVDSLVFDQPEVVVGPVTVAPGVIDPATGRVTGATSSELRLDLSADEVRRLFTAPLFAGVRVVMPGTSGQTVRFLPSDFLTVKAYAQVKFNVNFD